MTQSSTTPPPPEEIWALCRVDRSDIFHVRYTLEAYEGLCIPTTLPGGGGLVRVIAEARQRDELRRVLEGLGDEIGLEILEWGEGRP
jgi:hypothetical protein